VVIEKADLDISEKSGGIGGVDDSGRGVSNRCGLLSWFVEEKVMCSRQLSHPFSL